MQSPKMPPVCAKKRDKETCSETQLQLYMYVNKVFGCWIFLKYRLNPLFHKVDFLVWDILSLHPCTHELSKYSSSPLENIFF